MRLEQFDDQGVAAQLADRGLDLRLGPFTVRVHSRLPELGAWLCQLYGHQRVQPSAFADFHVGLESPPGLRRILRPQSVFSVDGLHPFHPLPRAHAGPSFEWGLNWCIATRAHRYLIFHSAVLERDGKAVLLPGDPGAGKSTLCAALAYSGWRLLSDELGLLDRESGLLYGLARPVNLKNDSITVIRELLPDATMSDPCHDTIKGSVALVAPPRQSVDQVQEPARARWVVTPQFAAGSPARLEPHSRATSFMELAHNSFNYSILGLAGFDALETMMQGCDCYHFSYSRLQDAIRVFDAIAADG